MQRELEASSAGDKVSAWKEYKSLASGQSNAGARIAAHKVLGKHIFWDWDRTYHIIVSPPHLISRQFRGREKDSITPRADPRFVRGNTISRAFTLTNVFSQSAIKRLLACAPYADLLWFETNTPSVEAAARVARTIRAQYPGKCVHSFDIISSAYNPVITDSLCIT